jgi:hypothetical protein
MSCNNGVMLIYVRYMEIVLVEVMHTNGTPIVQLLIHISHLLHNKNWRSWREIFIVSYSQHLTGFMFTWMKQYDITSEKLKMWYSVYKALQIL